ALTLLMNEGAGASGPGSIRIESVLLLSTVIDCVSARTISSVTYFCRKLANCWTLATSSCTVTGPSVSWLGSETETSPISQRYSPMPSAVTAEGLLAAIVRITGRARRPRPRMSAKRARGKHALHDQGDAADVHRAVPHGAGVVEFAVDFQWPHGDRGSTQCVAVRVPGDGHMCERRRIG